MITLKHGQKIGKATVIVDIVKKGNPEIRPAYKMNPTHVTYHNTGNSGRGADAKAHNRYIHNMANLTPKDTGYASWHLSVDDKYIIQHIPFNETAWHCGDGSGPKSGNMTSIGIEICENPETNTKQAEENAIALGVYLAQQFNISIGNHVPHQKWSGKYCPRVILKRDGSFSKFHGRIKKAWNARDKKPSTTTTAKKESTSKLGSDVYGTITITTTALNIRQSASLKSKIVGVAKKGEKHKVYGVKNGLYHLGGKKYCSASSKYSKLTKNPNYGKKSRTNTVTVLASSLWVYNKADWNAKHKTVKKGEVFTVVKTLTVKGSKMYQLKSGLYITANPKYVKIK